MKILNIIQVSGKGAAFIFFLLAFAAGLYAIFMLLDGNWICSLRGIFILALDMIDRLEATTEKQIVLTSLGMKVTPLLLIAIGRSRKT